MAGKIVVITGSSSGIGLETAAQLAEMGAEIILTGRDEHKLKLALESIKTRTGNNKLKYYKVDFSSQKSIHALADAIKEDYEKIDVLINNAGGFFTGFQLTEDGLERTIAINHFAYFLLTNLMLEHLLKSEYARIICVSSESHYNGKINFLSFIRNVRYNFRTGYSQSKLANVLFALELAERVKHTQVTVNALHPGFVKTDIGNKGTKWYLRWFWTLTSALWATTVSEGAKTSVYLASSDEVKGVTGKYFDHCKEKVPSTFAQDSNLQKQLWQVSEELCPVK